MMVKLVSAIILIGILASFCSPSDQGRLKEKQSSAQEFQAKIASVNLGDAVYTEQDTMVCPLGILFERQSSKGIDAARQAAATVIGRSRAIAEAGCQEWKKGIRIYISNPDPSLMWQSASIYADGPNDILVLTEWLTNNKDGASMPR